VAETSGLIDLRCPSCGSTDLDPLPDGRYHCRSCSRDFPVDKSIPTEAQGLLSNAIDKRNRALDFDEASEILTDFIERFSNCSSGYYQRLLSSNGISYQNENDERINYPTLSRLSEKPITQEADYKKAIELAENDALRNYYIHDIQRIEDLRKAAYATTNNKEKFDIFICFKASLPGDKKAMTHDYLVGQKIYSHYSSRYQVFFSPFSIDEFGVGYEPIIYHALRTARIMLVIGTDDPSYLSYHWVKNEWSRFLAMMRDEGPTTGRVIVPVLDENFPFDKLPHALKIDSFTNGTRQYIDAGPDLYPSIDKLIGRYLNVDRSDVTTLTKGKIVTQAIQRQEIKDVSHAHRSLGANAKVSLHGESSEQALLDIQSSLSENSTRGFEESKTTAEDILIKEKDNGKAALYWVYAVLHVTNPSLFAAVMEKTWLPNEKDKRTEIFEKLDIAFNNLPASESQPHFDALVSSLSVAFSHRRIEDFCDTFSFLTGFVNNDEDLVWANNIAMKGLVSQITSSKGATKAYVDQIYATIYPSLTKTGSLGVAESLTTLGKAFLEHGDFASASFYAERSLNECFAGDPNALWICYQCHLKANSFSSLVERINSADELVTVLQKMIAGGYKISDSPKNYYTIAKSLAVALLDSPKKKKLGKKLYEAIYSSIPSEYEEYLYKTAIDFPEILLLKGEFAEAERYFKTVLSKDEFDMRATWGIFKCQLKVRSNYGLLLLKDSFKSEKFHTFYSSLRTAESHQKGDENSTINDFNALHNQIMDGKNLEVKSNEGYSRRHVKSFTRHLLKDCERYCIATNSNPSIEWILEHRSFHLPDLMDLVGVYFHNDQRFNVNKMPDGPSKMVQLHFEAAARKYGWREHYGHHYGAESLVVDYTFFTPLVAVVSFLLYDLQLVPLSETIIFFGSPAISFLLVFIYSSFTSLKNRVSSHVLLRASFDALGSYLLTAGLLFGLGYLESNLLRALDYSLAISLFVGIEAGVAVLPYLLSVVITLVKHPCLYRWGYWYSYTLPLFVITLLPAIFLYLYPLLF